MVTEEDFQKTLDADPTDWQTRLVFADWLQERDDPRADGYRALGIFNPSLNDHSKEKDSPGFVWWKFTSVDSSGNYPLWLPWWELIEDGRPFPHFNMGKCFKSRRSAENAAALAFSRLPADRRLELLAGMAVSV